MPLCPGPFAHSSEKGIRAVNRIFCGLEKKRIVRLLASGLRGGWRRRVCGSAQNSGATKGLNGDALFVGWLEGDRKYAALRGASLLALPSYQENFGICLIEALAYGVPVLVSPHVNLAPGSKRRMQAGLLR